MAYQSGVCTPWITDADVTCTDADPAVIADAATAAVEVLFALSGHQFTGECERTIRPTVPPSILGGRLSGGQGWGAPTPLDEGPGQTVVWSDPYYVVDLGYDFVKDVTQVKIDGVILPGTSYRTDEARWLVRTDGEPWPYTQRRMQALTEVGTWEVQFKTGEDAPQLGVMAAQYLACNIALALTPGASGCKLPQRAQSIARQGINMVMLDPFEFLNNRRTGIYIVDLFLATYNPEDVEGNAEIGLADNIPPVIRET